MITKKIVVLILALLIFEFAQASDVVQIDPAKIRLSIVPGNAKTGTINAYNYSADPKEVRVYLQDWLYLPVCDGSKDFKAAGSTDLSAASWISFVPSEFLIPAYGKKIINYTVKVPLDAKGGHYAVLFFENYYGEQKEPAKSGVTVNLALRVASLFYIEPAGTIERQIKINNLKITNNQGRFYVTADFANTGNVDITAKSDFFIIDKKGVPFARGEFNEVYSFLKDTTELSASWKEPLPKGQYDLVLTADISRPLREAGLPEAPAVTKEAEIQVGNDGEVIRIGDFN